MTESQDFNNKSLPKVVSQVSLGREPLESWVQTQGPFSSHAFFKKKAQINPQEATGFIPPHGSELPLRESELQMVFVKEMVRRSNSVYRENEKDPLSLFIDHCWHIQWPVCTSSFRWIDISVKKKKNHSSSAKAKAELLPKALRKDLKLIINSARRFHVSPANELNSLQLPLEPALAENAKAFAQSPPPRNI